MFVQTITPNPHIPCKPGWCLQYVRQAFGLPAIHPTATAAWLASKSKHRDRNFPAGVWLAVWFSLANEPAGHVALMAPDGSVFSTSDLSNTPHHHLDLSDLMNYYVRYGMTLTYLGWTEDVQGIPVMAAPNLAAQGTITPLSEEDELSAEGEKEIKGNLQKVVPEVVGLKEFVAGMNDKLDTLVKAASDELLFDQKVNEKVDELVGNVRKTFWNSEESKIILANTPAPQVAAQINAAGLASEVRDELVKLLGGK